MKLQGSLFCQARHSSSSGRASVLHSSFWASLLPRRFRLGAAAAQPAVLSHRRQEATSFVVLSMFVGSMAIHQLTARREAETFARKSARRVAQLKDVVDRLQRGEQVDMVAALGSGSSSSSMLGI